MAGRSIDNPGGLFELAEVEDGIVLARAAPVPIVNSNAVIVDLGGRLLVVDTHARPSAARSIIAFIRERFSSPVAYVVDTHHHSDHAWGNDAYREAWPDVVVIAHPWARTTLVERTPTLVAEELTALPDELAALDARAAAEPDPGGRERLHRELEDLRAYGDELRALRRPSVDLAVETALTIHGDRREVQLWHPGRAHTAGDLVVLLAAERIAITGDVVIGWTPYVGDGYPEDWAAGLRELEATDVETLLLGHGRPDGRAWLALFRAYLEDLVRETRAAVEAGVDPEETRQEVRRRLAPTYEAPFMRQAGSYRPWPELVLANIDRTYQLLS